MTLLSSIVPNKNNALWVMIAMLLASCGGGGGGSPNSMPGFLNQAPFAASNRDSIIAFCLYDANGGNSSQKEYALQDGVCVKSKAAKFNAYNPEIPYSGQMLHNLSSNNSLTLTFGGRTLSYPDRTTIIDDFTPPQSGGMAHGVRVRDSFFKDSFFANTTTLTTIDNCNVGTNNDNGISGSDIATCFRGLANNRIINTSFSEVGQFIKARQAHRRNLLIVTAAGNNTYNDDDDPPTDTPTIDVSETAWNAADGWKDNYRMIVVVEAYLDDDGTIKRHTKEDGYRAGSVPCGYTQDRCLASFGTGSKSFARGTSFSAPQIASMLSNIYAIWNHLWPDDDPDTTAVNEASPQELVKLLLECATHGSNRIINSADRTSIGHGLASYRCLLSPQGTISLPSGFIAPSSDSIGGLAVAGSRILGEPLLIFDSFERDFVYSFASTSDAIPPLWRQALLHNKQSSKKFHFAHHINHPYGVLTFVHDRKEFNLFYRDHDYGLLLSLNHGERGGNDFYGSGLFRLKSSFKTRVGYHHCHRIANNHCLLTHASWEQQYIRGRAGSLVKTIAARRYDMAFGWRYERSYKPIHLSLSLQTGLHSALRGTIRLRNGKDYSMDGAWERRVDTQASITW